MSIYSCCSHIKKACFPSLFLSLAFIFLSCGRAHRIEDLTQVERMNDLNEWRHRPFDSGWKFHRGEAPGAEFLEFDDEDWRLIDVPHDWSIEDLPASADTFPNLQPPRVGPFTPASPGGLSTGFVLGGTGWYRKSFVLDTDDLDKLVFIRFDGVYMNADFWINGHHLGNHPYGYTSFYYELTPYLKPAGETNVIAVEVKNIGRNSRWYSGSGIFRHVWLDVVNNLHLKTWGLTIHTQEIREEFATINLSSTIRNGLDEIKEIKLETQIIDPSGERGEIVSVEGTVPTVGEVTIDQEISIENPVLWSLDSPGLYLVQLTIYSDEIPVDRYVSTFGIRTIEFSIDGFRLNGRSILLRGGNMHHDNGPLGSAAIDRAEFRRVELMKKNGYNAIRTSHNPPSTSFLNACDQIGMVVIDEAFDMWQRPKNPEDYSRYFDDWWEKDLSAMIKRDKNHPSVIIWSIGNEINERADSSGLVLTQKMYELAKDLDPSRPITAAICSFWDHPGRSWEATAPAFALLDIGGYNYQWRRYLNDHENYPSRIMIGTESIALESYDYWNQVEKNAFVLGDFIWTAMDYLGEASIGHSVIAEEKKDDFLLSWPWFNAWCGDIDLCGFKKPQSYYRDVVWGLSDLEMMVHVPVPDGMVEDISFWGWPQEENNWNWDVEKGTPLKVSVYSDYKLVKLFLNGTEINSRIPETIDTIKYKTTFEVPYEEGTLEAVGFENGEARDSVRLITTGPPANISLKPDRDVIRHDRNDLCYVIVEVCDSEGLRIPDAELMINFQIDGNGKLAAVGNGNPKDMKSFQSPFVKSFKGRCLVILKPTGERGNIQLKASSGDLLSETINIKVR